MTGEIDLEGNARQIGGLYSKLQGAMNAGAKVVLIPKSNEKDLDTIFSKEDNEIKSLETNKLLKNNTYSIEPSYSIDKNTKMFRNTMTIRLVENIYDILKFALVENDMKFNSTL